MTGEVVTGLKLKSIITQSRQGGNTPCRPRHRFLGAAYGGEADIATVEVSVDGGSIWAIASFIGPHEPFSWRQWQFVWEPGQPGDYGIMARATDPDGRQQPMNAQWNVLGYSNNGVREHGITVHIR